MMPARFADGFALAAKYVRFNRALRTKAAHRRHDDGQC